MVSQGGQHHQMSPGGPLGLGQHLSGPLQGFQGFAAPPQLS